MMSSKQSCFMVVVGEARRHRKHTTALKSFGGHVGEDAPLTCLPFSATRLPRKSQIPAGSALDTSFGERPRTTAVGRIWKGNLCWVYNAGLDLDIVLSQVQHQLVRLVFPQSVCNVESGRKLQSRYVFLYSIALNVYVVVVGVQKT